MGARLVGPCTVYPTFPLEITLCTRFLNIYTEFHRADGPTVWLHMGQWEGAALQPREICTARCRKYTRTGAAGYSFRLSLTKVILPVEVPPDTSLRR